MIGNCSVTVATGVGEIGVAVLGRGMERVCGCVWVGSTTNIMVHRALVVIVLTQKGRTNTLGCGARILGSRAKGDAMSAWVR